MRPTFVVVMIPGPPPMEGAAGGRVHAERPGGLSVASRLVLSAQDAGAERIMVADRACVAALTEELAERLRVPLEVGPPPADRVTVEVPSEVVVHPSTWRALVDAVSDGRARHIGTGAARVEARPEANARVSHGPPVPLVFAQQFGFPPMHVHDRASARRATTALLDACRRPQDGWTSKYLHRHVSLAITRLLLGTSLRPHHLTIAVALVGVFGGVVAARGTHEDQVIGAFLLLFQSMLAGCDGELARITYRHSRSGAWMDTLGDDLSTYAFFAGASYGIHRASGSVSALVFGAVILGCGLLTSAIEYRYLLKSGSGDLLDYPIDIGARPSSEGAQLTLFARIAGGLSPLFRRDSFILLTFLAAVLNQLAGILAACAVGAIAILGVVLRAEHRRALHPTAG